jgi:alkaline phosphatase D
MIAIWDDHEFSDDAHGVNATYFDGLADEADESRRKNANQAWFEYMPVDYRNAPDFQYDPQVAFPNDIEIFRDLRFGKHLHLVLTDLRTRRSDHLVPEDALPGAVILDQATLVQHTGSIPESAEPYIDIDTFNGGLYQQTLSANAAALGLDTSKITGMVDVSFINAQLQALTDLGSPNLPLPIDDTTAATLERGYAFLHLGKRGPYANLGSRYFLIKPIFELYADIQYAQTNKASEQAMGDAQQQWFLDTLQNSEATWKVWGNEFCLIPLAVDLSIISTLPPAFAQQFLLSAEDWGGLPNRRDDILDALSNINNVVAITGDIHAFFAGTPHKRDDPSKRVVELVTAGISSTSYRQLLVRTASSDPVLAAAGATALAAGIESFLLSRDSAINPHLAYADTNVHGFAIVSVSADFLEADFYKIPAANALTDLTEDKDALSPPLHHRPPPRPLRLPRPPERNRRRLETMGYEHALMGRFALIMNQYITQSLLIMT